VRVQKGGSNFLLVSALDSLDVEVASHKSLLEGREDFFREVLDYNRITIKILGFFRLFLKKRGGGSLKHKLNKILII
jgi:hypothetical protein